MSPVSVEREGLSGMATPSLTIRLLYFSITATGLVPVTLAFTCLIYIIHSLTKVVHIYL